MARLLAGKPLAERIQAGLKGEFERIRQKLSRQALLASIEVGHNPAARVYVNAQKKVSQELGVEYRLVPFNSDVSEARLMECIQQLNRDSSVDGIIVQMPLPPQIDYKKVSRHIDVHKDVEGMHPQNLGQIIFGEGKIIPCTASAVMELLVSTGIELYGKDTVIVGHSEIVGKPLSLLLLDKFASVSVCHIGTSKAGKLKEYVSRAEVLVVAVGKPEIIKGEWIKKNAVVIDVGINKVEDRIVGDVEFIEAEKQASWITPVPGGVGPLTVTMLMRNLVEAIKLQQAE